MRNGFPNEKGDRLTAAEKEIKMNLIKTLVKGMPEYGPLEAQIRENALNRIKNTYDIENRLGLSVLGIIPEIRTVSDKKSSLKSKKRTAAS